MQIVLNILLLLISLSVLICLHELGHLVMAKAFNVYCFEYSIGMGPLLFKIKKPNQETQFSLRLLPIGGYVSMAGEGAETTVPIPEERYLNKIKKWKRALILVAGVTMNLILAIIMFLISAFTSPILDDSKMYWTISESKGDTTYLAYDAGLRSGEDIKEVDFELFVGEQSLEIVNEVSTGRELYNTLIIFDTEDSPYYTSEFKQPKSVSDKWNWKIITSEDKVVEFTVLPKEMRSKSLVNGTNIYYVWDLDSMGITPAIRARNFKEAMDRFSYEFTTSFTSLGTLFQKGGWENLGGIISVYNASSYATSVGVYYFFFIWGYVSLNLAIVNLLPFPGLDGWQLLVTGIEALTRKNVPQKVANIVSVVGLILLFALVAFVTFMDIYRLV